MNRSNKPWLPLENAGLEWNADNSFVSSRFGDFYFSTEGALDEGEHVLLRGNKIPERWGDHPKTIFTLVETGFGTGLNFLLTWAAWQQQPHPKPRLHYASIEKYPLTKGELSRALTAWPTLQNYADQLINNYPEPIPGQHRIVFADGAVILDLWWEDVAEALPEIAARSFPCVDAWYLDGFSPDRNQSMWTQELYDAMARASHSDATFATFTSAGDVRRGLLRAGFQVFKAPGFGKKREHLRGNTPVGLPVLQPTDTPWDIPGERSLAPQSALVVGAGLAGCTIAAALAQRGIKVTVLEEKEMAGGGSGNGQGILYTRLSARHSALTDFSIQSFCFAHNFYRNLFEDKRLQEKMDGELCGNFSQSQQNEEMSALAQVLGETPELAQVLDAERASAKLGVKQDLGGYWYPKSGWLRPASVCRELIDHPNITVLEHLGDVTLQPKDERWHAMVGPRFIALADCAIVATGTRANTATHLSWLPLQAIRGQTTDLPGNVIPAGLKAGFCHTGYIAPIRDNQHCIGATFDLRDDCQELRRKDHIRNLEALAIAIPTWRKRLEAVDVDTLSGRVSYRCATPDYLPIVGPVPNYDSFLQTYAALRKNAKQCVPARGNYLPGLFVTTGHGSRGLTSTPLAAQLLASQICGELTPVSKVLSQALSPGRFLIRKLRRNQL
ncbi:MAG: bifunctional tRNA (5-methylaminomethyl-2-thiouridine)(34)-methyltransferase MnmD/FAD-dependent 5-carboxymethylaminomethyl-2-thiouridine(34) oxidoreductase MnmC [Halioglobus sp.]